MSGPTDPPPKELGPRFRGDERKVGGFPWILTLAVILALCLLIGLGVWQVQRLQWKQGLIAQAEIVSALPPAPLDRVLADEKPEFRRATLACDGLDTAATVSVRSIEEGRAGVRLVSACPLPPGSTYDSIFVDRGFLADEPDRVFADIPYTGQVDGVLRALPSTDPIRSMLADPSVGQPLTWRDPQLMRDRLGVERPAPFTLYALNPSNPEWAGLRPSAPPPAFSNNHLGYAITWFGLALVLVGFYVALLRRRLGKPAS